MIVVRGAPTAATQDTATDPNVLAGQYSWAEYQKLIMIQNDTGAGMYIRYGGDAAPAAASRATWHTLLPTGSPPARITVRLRYLSIWVPTGGTWTYQGTDLATVTIQGWKEGGP